MPPRRPALVLTLAAAVATGGCGSFGATRLSTDQVDYSRAIDLAQKRQTLSNIVGLRYAESPSFLPVSSIIAAYSFDRTLTSSIQGGTAVVGSTLSAGGTALYSNRPTFTFTPVKGEDFANGYIRPMAPSLVLPLAQSGVPIDLLMRIVVQSIGDLQNSAALSGKENAGTIGFYELIHCLRRLQLKGALTVRFEHGEKANRVFLAIDPTRSDDRSVAADADQARKLLKVPASAKEIEVVYGAVPERGAAVGMVTRSITGILTELGAQIEVPDGDVQAKATFPTVKLLQVESRPTIVIHSGEKAPPDVYAEVAYRNRHFWIDPMDFDSKFAFSVVQNLIALAESSQNAKTPIVTIPAG